MISERTVFDTKWSLVDSGLDSPRTRRVLIRYTPRAVVQLIRSVSHFPFPLLEVRRAEKNVDVVDSNATCPATSLRVSSAGREKPPLLLTSFILSLLFFVV